jgi:molybdopterin/thiamine biosynthesis adenylyltransferase
MPGKFHHERLYRGDGALDRLAEARIVVCGAGAVGSNLVDHLARQGAANLRVIDRDRVEEHNVGTQVWAVEDVGTLKAETLRNRVFRTTGAEIEAVTKELGERNVRKLLADADLVIDGFDNSASRRLVTDHCAAQGLPCLHVGLNADYAEVIWNDRYRVPSDVAGDVCDYPLARNLILMAVAVAGETVLRFLADGVQESRTLTMRDFAVQPFEG